MVRVLVDFDGTLAHDADVRGAERHGMRAALVRKDGGFGDLIDAARWIVATA